MSRPATRRRATTGWRIALLALCVAWTAAGCRDALTGDGRQILKFSSWGATQDQVVYAQIFERFEAAHPGVRMSLMFIPFGNYFTKLQLLLIGGVAPDTVTVGANMVFPLKENGYLVDLQPYIERERLTDPGFLTESEYYIDVVSKCSTFNGHMYYIPIGPMSLHLYYNKDLFDAAGVPYPHEGWTWDDFLDAARRLTLREGDRTIQWGYLCTNWWDVWRLFVLQNGGDTFDSYEHPTRCLLDSPETLEAFHFLQDLIYKYRVSPTPAQATQNVSTDFMTGRLAMTIHGTWMVEQYRTITQFRWDMGPLPMRKRYANLSGAGGYGMTNQCRDREMAWAFLRNFLTEETQRIMSTDVALWQPILRRAADDGHMDRIPGVPEHHNLRFTELSRAVPNMPLHHPQANRIMDTITQALDQVFLGKETPEECLGRVVPEVNALLRGDAGKP